MDTQDIRPSYVTGSLGGGIGNSVLMVYRAFWFAKVHGIPAANVVWKLRRDLTENPLFANVKEHFIPESEYNKLDFSTKLSFKDRISVPDARMRLTSFSIPAGTSVSIEGCNFIYPEYKWEKALFARLFDNKPFRNSVADKYRAILAGDTVGYTVRRTDRLRWVEFKALSAADIVRDLNRIVDSYSGLVRIVATSEDPEFVRNVVGADSRLREMVNVFYDDTATSIYLLSMCDTVLSNGEYQCVAPYIRGRGLARVYYTSTFGQIAQALNRSYPYAGLDEDIGAAQLKEAGSGCGIAYPCPNAGPTPDVGVCK